MIKPNSFDSFEAFYEWLLAKSSFHMDLVLNRVERALKALKLSPANYKVIQVLGTNGKGSTSTFIASLSQANGYKTGLFTSPHFISPLERVLVDSKPLSKDAWCGYANKILAVGGHDLTFFEFVTVLAALAFADLGVELAVFEAGLGGKNDATTSIAANLHVFTPIALDHQHIIGPSLEDIAQDKAAALGVNALAVSAKQQAGVSGVLNLAAQEKKSRLVFIDSETSLLKAEFAKNNKQLGLWGAHQFANASLALLAWRCFCEAFAFKNDANAELKALEQAWIAGRMQWVLPNKNASNLERRHPLLLLDGAHNPHALALLGKILAEAGVRPAACIFTCVGDKDVENMVAHLRVLCPAPIFVPPLLNNPRALNPSELAGRIGMAATAVSSFAEALQKAKAAAFGLPENQPVLLCGSLYLLAEFFELYPEYLNAEQRLFPTLKLVEPK